MMSDLSFKEEQEVEILFGAPEISSGEEPPMSEWSSLEQLYTKETENVKKQLYNKGLYSPGSADICTKYVCQSDSSVIRHPYYKYPAIIDPGIENALLAPEQPVIYPDDGQALYLHLCSEGNQCPVRLFHKNLLNSEISLSFYGVDPRNVRAMAMALQYNKYVHVFNLTDNFLTDDSCYHLGHMLKSNVTLKELILVGCRMGASGLLSLGVNLISTRTLELLNLARNQLGDAGGVYFANLVSNGINIKKINLSNNSLGRETALSFAEALEWSNPFTHLDLSWNNFVHTPSTAKMLEKLGSSKILQELYLSYNALEGERIGNLIKSLLQIPTIRVLDLSHNRFQGEAIAMMITGLIYAKKLDIFDLSYNPMSAEDAYNTLEKMLRPRVKLQNLLMENVDVNKSFLQLLEKVRKMKSRKNFVVTYGMVLHNWVVKGPDPRDLILNRADYLGKANKKHRTDIGLYFLKLGKDATKPMPVKELLDQLSADSVPLNEDVIEELCLAFPGPKVKKSVTIDIDSLCEYIKRIWPDKKLPPTPPPEPEPVVLPPPPPKGKGKGKGKK